MAQQEQGEMSFLGHLEILRWTLIRSTLAVFIGGSIAFAMKNFIFNKIIFAPKEIDFVTYRFLCNISKKFGTDGLCIDNLSFLIQNREMAGQFSAHIWTSITAGFIMAFPYILFEIWKFIKPGLYPKEQKNAKWFILISSLLFFTGVLFGYYVITPLSINFLGNYSIANQVKNQIDIPSYIGLLRACVLSAGLLFELPIIIFFLTKLGLVTPEFLQKQRKYAFVLVLILAAVITPPDVISQVIVAIPMVILYEASVAISKIIIKREKKTNTNPQKI